MKRRAAHAMFGAAAALCAVFAGYEAFRLREAARVNEAIAAADAEVASTGALAGNAAVGNAAVGNAAVGNAAVGNAAVGNAAASSAGSSSTVAAAGTGGGGDGSSRDLPLESATRNALPEAQFAHAVALAKRGDYEGALKQYKVLSRGARADLATDAFYNAGNLQLREALKEGRDARVRALPLIELAKQSYRGALRRDPQAWDARYNLERALWLAPELDEVLSESITRDAENRVMSTLQSTRADLP